MKRYTMVVHFDADNDATAESIRDATTEYLADAESWLQAKLIVVDAPEAD